MRARGSHYFVVRESATQLSGSIRAWYHTTQQAALIDCLEMKSGCIETLQYLKQRGLYLSIVSNIDDDMLEPLIAREQLHHYFDH